MSTSTLTVAPSARSERDVAAVAPTVIAAAGGLCLSAAFDPVSIAYCAPLSVAAFTYAVARATYRQAAVRGLVFGGAFLGPLLVWLGDAVGTEAWLAVVATESLWFAALGGAAVAVRRLPGWPVWVAVLWMAAEALRSTWPLGGLPWGRLGFAAVDSPWQSALPVVGVTGVGYLLALLGATLGAVAATWPPGMSAIPPGAYPTRLVLLAVGLAALAVATLLVGSLAPAPSTTGMVRVAVVQGGVPGDGKELVRYHRQVTDQQAEGTERLAANWDGSSGTTKPPAFVLWPENATAVDPARDAQAALGLDEAYAAAGVPIFFGAVTDAPDPGQAFNQGLLWGPAGLETQRYTKQHLVPFGEYIPLRRWLAGLSPRLEAIRRDMQPGPPAAPLTIAGVRVGDALCFDVAYDDVLATQVRGGAQLLTVQTSNAMFLGTSQLDQQFTISRARALETGRSVVVASVNGQSGAIGPDGAVLERLPRRVGAESIVTVPLASGQTPAVRLGSSLSVAVVALAGAALMACGIAAMTSWRPPKLFGRGPTQRARDASAS